MKRFSKILVAVLALCLLVGALALAISANSGVDGKFVVKGVGYDDWSEAVAAADNSATIYINEDVTFDSSIVVSGEGTNLKVNLNGKTVTVNHTGFAFNVHTNASFTLEGSGTFNNVSTGFIGGSSSADITVNATGAGIVINHAKVSATDTTAVQDVVVSTFRVYGDSTLAVSGKLTANTVNGVRYFFNLTATSDSNGADSVTFKNADIYLPLPSEVECRFGKIIAVSANISITMDNSDFNVEYGQIFDSAQSAYASLDSTYFVADSQCVWADTAASTLVDKLGTMNVFITAKDSKFVSNFMEYDAYGYTTYDSETKKYAYYGEYNEYTGQYTAQNYPGASLFDVTGAVDASFTDCIFKGEFRAITSNSGRVMDASGKVASDPRLNRHQLVFNDCHFMHTGSSNAWGPLFTYGVNFKMIGGSSSYGTISNGACNYLELADGRFVGGYLDNVLLQSATTLNNAITGQWVDSTKTAVADPVSEAVTLIIDGKATTFNSGYFSDTELYETYLPVQDLVSGKIIDKNDGSFEGDGYVHVDNSEITGDSPLGSAFGFTSNLNNSDARKEQNSPLNVLGVKDAYGNGYAKITYDSAFTYNGLFHNFSFGSLRYDQYQYFVHEIDVATDNGKIPSVSFPLNGRSYLARFNADGNYVALSGRKDDNNSFNINTAGNLVVSNAAGFTDYNGTKALDTTPGKWSRITIITEIIVGEAETIKIQAYSAADTKIDGTYVTVDNAHYVADSMYHIYLNGEYVGSVPVFDSTSGTYMDENTGKQGYVVDYYASSTATTLSKGAYQCYVDGIRVTTVPDPEATVSFDNARRSAYKWTDGIDLGFRDSEGALKQSLAGLEHFLIMPDNNYHPVADVDGVEYMTEADALAAIKEGSVVTLLENFSSYINKSGVSYTLIPNGNTFPGFVSSTHKPVDYTGSLGGYVLVEASADEIYSMSYTFNGDTVVEYAALGTYILPTSHSFAPIADGASYTAVESWTLPATFASDYALAEKNFVATPVIVTDTYDYSVDGVGYKSLEEAVTAANGKDVKLNSDIELTATVNVNGTTLVLDLNGKTVTVNHTGHVFNVYNAGKLTVKGSGAFNNVGGGGDGKHFAQVIGEGSSVTVDARGNGIAINHAAATTNTTGISTFRIYDKASMTVKGKLDLNYVNGMRYGINMQKSSSTVGGASSLTVQDAKINFNTPTTAGIGRGQLFIFSEGANITITDSEVYANFAHMFYEQTTGAYLSVSTYQDGAKGWTDPTTAAKSLDLPDCDVFITATGSVLSAARTSYSTTTSNCTGTFAWLDSAKVKMDFEDCIIYAHNRAIGANSNYRASSGVVNPCQLTFTDCHIINSDSGYGSDGFMAYGVNYKMIGGSVYMPGKIAHGTAPYLELTDANGNPTGEWIGAYVDNVLLGYGSDVAPTLVYGDWNWCVTMPDGVVNYTSNIPSLVIRGVSYAYDTAWFSDADAFYAYKGVSATLAPYLVTMGNGNIDGADYYKDNAATATGSLNLPLSVNTDKGIAESVTAANGNGYVKFSYTNAPSTISQSASKYINVDTCSAPVYNYAANTVTAASRNFKNYSNYVFEIDVSTDDGRFPAADFTYQGRYYMPKYDAEGNQIGAQYVYGPSAGVNISGNKLNTALYADFRETIDISTIKGDWTRITMVIDAKISATTTMVDYPTYTVKTYDSNNVPTAWTQNEEGTVTLESYSFEGTMCYVYVDGTLVDSIPFLPGQNGYLPVGYETTFCTDDVRTTPTFYYGTSSICFDNVRFSAYTRSANVDLGMFENGAPKASIAELEHFLIMPDNNALAIATVDGVGYYTEADAIAAIKENSVVELHTNFESALESSVSYKLITNGKTFPGFVSATHTYADYSQANGVYYVIPAASSEIFNVNYSYAGVNGSQTAALGTILKAPAEYDSFMTPVLNTEAKQYSFLGGWTLVDGQNVVVVTKNATAVPVTETVDAVVVIYKNGDDVLDTDYYFPGEKTVLDEFNGTDVTVDTAPEWYSIARTGWNADELAAATAGLATGGEYVVNAVIGKVAPENIPGLKLNLALYANYVLNFYVPADVEGIEGLTVATKADGTNSISYLGEGSIAGSTTVYDKFSYRFGVADTRLITFYIVYTVEGTQISFEMQYGVPAYAAAAMTQHSDDELTKTLVINLANYADKVLTLAGDDKTSTGAQIYTMLLQQYGETYLANYNNLSNEMFAEGGSIYNEKVAGLNWVTKTGATDGDNTALSYVDGINFVFDTYEPVFQIRLSEDAVAKGLQTPDAYGHTGYFAQGLHVYTSYGSGDTASNMWAEKDGNKYYGDSDIWLSNGSTEYKYYVISNDTSALNTEHPERQDWYSLWRLARQDVSFIMKWNETDGVVPETIGAVNYNLAAYISDLVENAKANAQYIEAAKALYAFADASANYKGE